jgi:signal transduction histidine kinase/ligand-binding sensor domain-containing protein
LALGLLLGLCASARSAAGQVVNFRAYTGADGLPQSQVLAIHQDRQGYLWFATYAGLSRFDGEEFRTWTKEEGLSSNTVWDVAEDSDGRLLLATARGACIEEANRFTCFRARDGLASDETRSIAADRAGNIWVATPRGVSRIRDRSITTFGMADGLPSERVGRIAIDSHDQMWASTDRGLARFDGARFALYAPDVIGNAAVQFLVPTRDGILIGASGRLFEERGSRLTRIAADGIPEAAEFVDAAIEANGTIWIATRSGVLRIHDGGVDTIGVQNGLPTTLVNRVMVDREGDVWFGTDFGASKHVPGPFSTYTNEDGLPNPFVRAMAVDDHGVLWAGTRDGVAVLDGNRFRAVPLDGVPHPRVYGLARDPAGGMLIGTRLGLVRYRAGRTTVYHEKDGLPGDVVYCFAPDGQGGVWIGTNRGVAHLAEGRITTIHNDTLSGMGIISMARDSRGRLWMGRVDGGIAVLTGDSLRRLRAADQATDQTVWALNEDATGAMWAATNGDGALRIDDAGVRRFTMKDGLASNFIWQVQPDTHGDVWLFGNLGIDRLSADHVTHYGHGSGLIELEGSASASEVDTHGTLWFGSGSGVVRYVPGLDHAPAIAPLVYLDQATVDGKGVTGSQDGSGPAVHRGVIRFRFTSPSYRDESGIRFLYRLIGANAEWSPLTSEHSISYAGLSPGTYRFEVLAVSRDVQSARPATFAFRVLPAFWQTWWFRLLALVLVLAAATSLPVLRARALERERQRLEKLVAQHTRELAEKNARLETSNRDLEHFAYIASHDLQEPLRKIQAFSDQLTRRFSGTLDDQGRDYLSRMVGAAARMQRLIEDLLMLSRVTTKPNPPEWLDLASLVQEVLGDLEVRIRTTGGRVEVGVLPYIEGDPIQIRQIFQNLIGNALKFHRPGEAPVVRVTARSLDPETLEIVVEDNGIGFEAKDAQKVFLPFQRLHSRMKYEGTGIGLTICQKIVARHHGTIRAESAPGMGARFVVTLPVRGPIGEKHAA